MSRSDQNGLDGLDDIMQSLEVLRCHAVDMEAMAHAAAQCLEHLPYVPGARTKAGDAPGMSDDLRRQLGRLQSFVATTASAAHATLVSLEEIIDKAQRIPALKRGKNGTSHAREPAVAYGTSHAREPAVAYGTSHAREPAVAYGTSHAREPAVAYGTSREPAVAYGSPKSALRVVA